MRVLELFAGIGGLSLGLERAGMETVGFCELDPACRFWLREHWPGVPIWEDVTKLTGEEVRERVGAVDVVAGGFPCQDLSVAGKGAGLEGARSGLWFEMLRIVREVRPRWVCAENVPALRSRGSDTVLAGLEAEGYTAWPLVVGADDVGAPHRRKRVWIVARLGLADTDGERERDADELRRQQRARGAGAAHAGGRGETLAHGHGLGRGSGGESSGHPEGVEGRRGAPGHEPDGRGEWPVGDAPSLRRDRPTAQPGSAGAGEEKRGVLQPERAGTRWPARPGEPQHEWEAPRLIESGLGDAAHGLPRRVAGYVPGHRRAALKALGNAVCPQVAEVIGRAIMSTAL